MANGVPGRDSVGEGMTRLPPDVPEPDGGWTFHGDRPVSEVVPGLAQADDALEPDELFAAGFDAVVDLSHRIPMVSRELGRLFVWHPIPDLEHLDDPETIRLLARLVAGLVLAGRRVVVNCAAGLNRSGLLVARALIELGHGNEEAIEIVRRARGPDALSNRYFERWLLEELRPPRADGRGRTC